jgi:hypothetical protein
MPQRVLGILTEDFRLYHDLVAELKARDIPFESLSFHQRLPHHVGVIITSPGELPRVRFRHKVAAAVVDDAIAQALRLLQGKEGFEELIIGIDPGPRPGVAALGDGQVVEVRTADTPEAVAGVVGSVVRNHPSRRVLVRVGHGDPTNRNRIINALEDQPVGVEIADEGGTTPRDTRRDDVRNIEAALGIATTPGVRAKRHYSVEPTAGEVKDIQRLSRLGSRGEVTISRELASRVAKGKMTMEQAIERQRGRQRRPSGEP